MNEFHVYLKSLRMRQFKDTRKLCKIMGVDRNMWRKIERGINPPPKRSILKKFCSLVHSLSYEENQLYSLARRWQPHEDTNTTNHALSNAKDPKWQKAILEQNTPDYKHKFWKPYL
jgi:transcriptional regulator with XRE-family HTH domain